MERPERVEAVERRAPSLFDYPPLLQVMMLEDRFGRPVLLFPTEWKMNGVLTSCGDDLELTPFATAPDIETRRK